MSDLPYHQIYKKANIDTSPTQFVRRNSESNSYYYGYLYLLIKSTNQLSVTFIDSFIILPYISATVTGEKNIWF